MDVRHDKRMDKIEARLEQLEAINKLDQITIDLTKARLDKIENVIYETIEERLKTLEDQESQMWELVDKIEVRLKHLEDGNE